jgi:hypothetical protein
LVGTVSVAFQAVPNIGEHGVRNRWPRASTSFSADTGGVSFARAEAKVPRNKASLVAVEALSWMPSMPQTCEDDFDCNGGKANFPLQCLDMMVAKICVDPDDFQSSYQASADLAFVPLPVRADDDPWSQGQRR